MENQIIVYQPNETMRLDVRVENETVWLNQSRLGELFVEIVEWNNSRDHPPTLVLNLCNFCTG